MRVSRTATVPARTTSFTSRLAFIDEAITRGAVAVVTQRPVALPHGRVTLIQVGDARAALARVAQQYFRFPDRDLEVVGVTGTNGKTTVTHLIKHLLNGDQRIGLIGTVSYDLGARTVPSYKTTPESLDIFGMLAQMRDAGCRQAIMEVSSHGIDQKRVLGLHFGAVVFTNLTRDHLDYHKSLDAYFEVKSRLFAGGTGALPRVAIVNLDDPHGRQLAARLAPGLKLVTFGEHPDATVRAEAVSLESKRSTFRLVWPGGTAPVESPLIGRYNVSNLLAALATCHALGRDLTVLLPKLASFKNVAGRMERIEEPTIIITGLDQWRLVNPAISPFNPPKIASNMFEPSFSKPTCPLLLFYRGRTFLEHSYTGSRSKE